MGLLIDICAVYLGLNISVFFFNCYGFLPKRLQVLVSSNIITILMYYMSISMVCFSIPEILI